MGIEVRRYEIEDARREHQACKSGMFTTLLFQLIGAADVRNKKKLAKAYSGHVYVHLQYAEELHLVNFKVVD